MEIFEMNKQLPLQILVVVALILIIFFILCVYTLLKLVILQIKVNYQ